MSLLSIKRLTAATALVAMMVLQVSGGAVRYLCDCTGESVVTTDEHCHGEHGEEGPLAHATSGHRHDHDVPVEESPEEETHHHPVAVHTSSPADLPALVSAPQLRLLPVFRIELLEAIYVPEDRFLASVQPPRDDGQPPPASFLVTRSVVRLI